MKIEHFKIILIHFNDILKKIGHIISSFKA